MEAQFRPCEAADLDIAVPLIYSSAPAQFRYVFSVTHEEQAVKFLRFAFLKGKGQFGFSNHTTVTLDGEQVGVGALWTSKMNFRYHIHSAIQILSFYGLFNGLRVISRGLKMDTITKPAKDGIAYIAHLGIAQNMRGKGLGRTLIRHFLKQARQKSLPKAGLDVVEDNKRAKVLYENLSFRDVEVNPANLTNQFGRVLTHYYMETKV